MLWAAPCRIVSRAGNGTTLRAAVPFPLPITIRSHFRPSSSWNKGATPWWWRHHIRQSATMALWDDPRPPRRYPRRLWDTNNGDSSTSTLAHSSVQLTHQSETTGMHERAPYRHMPRQRGGGSALPR